MANWFHSARDRRVLAVLLIGVITLSVASLFLFQYYKRLNRNNISFVQAKRDVISWSVMANHLGHRRLKHLINQENHTWLRLELAKTALAKTVIVDSGNVWQLHQILAQQKSSLRLNIRLPKKGYLHVTGSPPNYLLQELALLFYILLIIIALLALCYWVIHMLSTPLGHLAKAVEKFGHDTQAPPLSLQGNEEMQAVVLAFNKMQQQVRSLLEDRTQMLAAIAHDLRTPITRLKLRAEYLQDQTLYDKVIADLRDMEQMVNSVLLFARQQDYQEAWQDFDLHILLETISDEFADTGQDITYHSEIVAENYHGPMLALKRALTNVIENALKYGSRCVVRLQIVDEAIMITIEDNGVGIPQAQLSQVLKPFYRVNNARSPDIPGAGLGLSVTDKVLTSIGGTLTLTNLPQQGLQVKICLKRRNKV